MQRIKEVIKQVRKLEITTKQLVDGIISGNYHSLFKGQGIEFTELREYRPGDDIRAIDWNVTARYNHPFIKEFIEERDLRAYFIFDYSASGNFGNLVEKRKKAIELTASLMFSAMRNNDNVGLLMFTDSVEKYIPARKGKKHVLKLLSHLVTFEPKSKKTNITNALQYFAKIIKRRSIIFLISDFKFDISEQSKQFFSSLAFLKNKHDVIAIQIDDSREKNIPDIGLIELEDEETGEQILVDTSDATFRENYKQLIQKEDEKLKTAFKKNKIDTIQIITDESYVVPLQKFFKKRLRKVHA